MKVFEVMSRHVITVTPDTSFKEIVERLLEHDISALPVVDTDGRLVGVVTEADLVAKEAYGCRRHRAIGLVAAYFAGRDPTWVRRSSGLTAADVMSVGVATASPDDDAKTAARIMLERHVKRLPVVGHAGQLQGIVSRRDLLRAFVRDDAAIQDEMGRVLADPLSVPENLDVTCVVDDGIVHLAGTAEYPHDIDALTRIAGDITGVVAVHSQVRARKPEPRWSAQLASDPRG
jgi:CBS-domain-containing membrane protein